MRIFLNRRITGFLHAYFCSDLCCHLTVIQVEQQRDFVERKRDEVSFSPNDQSSVESFLQVNFTLFPLLSKACGLPVLSKIGPSAPLWAALFPLGRSLTVPAQTV